MAAARPDEHRRDDRIVRALASWAEHDAARALHAVDRHVIRATEACRSLVLEHLGPAAPARDLFNACATLGRLMAEAGASPSLAAGTIDGAVRAIDACGARFDAARVGAARSSLFEGYVAALRDAERTASLAAWEWPACAVPLGEGIVAIACGFPSDDADALTAWAARVAGKLVKTKVRRVVLSGNQAAQAELGSAVELVGIAIVTEAELPLPSPAGPQDRVQESKGWLRLPWRK